MPEKSDRSQWQVFVCSDSEEGGILVAAELSEPSGFWLGLSAIDAAAAVISGAWVRLSDDWIPAGFKASLGDFHG